MRRVLTALAALALLAGCGAGPRQEAETIGPMTLNEDQQGIVDLLGMGEGILLFQFHTTEPYKTFEAWVEIYADGELVEEHAAGFSTTRSDPDAPWDGRLAITITEEPGYTWSFRLEDGQGGATSFKNTEPYPRPDTTARSFGALEETVPIEDGREIVLYSAVLTNSDTFAVYDTQEYLTNPDWIAEQENLHLIKCKFMK